MAADGESALVLLSTPKKCVHLHLYQTTKRWGAWVKDKRINNGVRLFVGTHKTKYLAARCQDRAILMIRHHFRGGGNDEPLKLNFKEADYEEDEDLRNSHTVEAFVKRLISESCESYKKVESKSKCLEKFLADVEHGRVADEMGPSDQTSQTEVRKLEARPDEKGKNKVTDKERQNEGEPSEVAPIISHEEMAKLFAAKQYCAICKKVWLQEEEGNFVQCDTCVLWVHAPCAGVTKKTMKELESGVSYHCPDCQRAHIMNIPNQDRQDLDMIKLTDKCQVGFRDLVISSPAEQADAGSTSNKAISCGIAEIELNLPNSADAELSEEHQAAFILCLLKNFSNRPDD